MHTNRNAYLHFSAIDLPQHEDAIPGSHPRTARAYKPQSARRRPQRELGMLPGHPDYREPLSETLQDDVDDETDPNGHQVYRNGQQFTVDSQLQHYGYHAGYAGPQFAPYGMPGSTFHDQTHQGRAAVAVDVDGDGIADYVVSGADRDGDGIPDALQGGPQYMHNGWHPALAQQHPAYPHMQPRPHPGFAPQPHHGFRAHQGRAAVAVDVDGDGIADYVVSGADRDGDGIPDALQGGPQFGEKSYYAVHGSYGRPVPQRISAAYHGNFAASPAAGHYRAQRPAGRAAVAVDVDGDGIADYIVSGADRDGDGIPDALQSGYRRTAPVGYKSHGAPRNLFG